MNRRRMGFGTLQRTVAWTAAYALVLQLMLLSAFSAALVGASPALAAPLCVSGETHAGDAGGPEKATTHCPLCLARVDAAVLPPPLPTPEIDRVAIELHYRVVVRDSLSVSQSRHPHQPRAPPAFA